MADLADARDTTTSSTIASDGATRPWGVLRSFSDLSIKQCFAVLLGVSFALLVGSLLFSLSKMSAEMHRLKRAEVQHLAESASSIAHSYLDRVKRGEMSEEEAKAKGRQQRRAVHRR